MNAADRARHMAEVQIARLTDYAVECYETDGTKCAALYADSGDCVAVIQSPTWSGVVNGSNRWKPEVAS